MLQFFSFMAIVNSNFTPLFIEQSCPSSAQGAQESYILHVSMDLVVVQLLCQSLIKHTNKTHHWKDKPSLVSAPIFRLTDQSTVKCHHFENCKYFYKELYGERARLVSHTKPYNDRNFKIDRASRYFGV